MPALQFAGSTQLRFAKSAEQVALTARPIAMQLFAWDDDGSALRRL